MSRRAIKIIIFAGLFIPIFIYAASAPLEYKLAAPIPGGGESAEDFTQYMGYLIPFLLSFAAIAALVMFVFGGIEYAASGGSADRVKRARERMTDAVIGLLLAVFSALILQTINPELINLKLGIEDVGNTASVQRNENGCPLNANGEKICGQCHGVCTEPGTVCESLDGATFTCRAFTPPPCDPSRGEICDRCTQEQLQECISRGATMCDIVIVGGQQGPLCRGGTFQ